MAPFRTRSLEAGVKILIDIFSLGVVLLSYPLLAYGLCFSTFLLN